MDIIEELKALPFTLNIEQDKDGVLTETAEFTPAYGYDATLDESLKGLAHDMKGWEEVLAGDFERWRKYHEPEVLYLLKVLVSSEDELLSCLKRSKCVNI